jgi:hypothetical protein
MTLESFAEYFIQHCHEESEGAEMWIKSKKQPGICRIPRNHDYWER